MPRSADRSDPTVRFRCAGRSLPGAQWVTDPEHVHEQCSEVGRPREPFPGERGHVTFPRGPEHAEELARSSPWQAVRAGVPGARTVRVVRRPGGCTGRLASGSPGGGGLLEAPKLIGLRRRGRSPAHRLWGWKAQTQELRSNLSARVGKVTRPGRGSNLLEPGGKRAAGRRNPSHPQAHAEYPEGLSVCWRLGTVPRG